MNYLWIKINKKNTIAGSSTIQCITIDQQTFFAWFAMWFQNIYGIYGKCHFAGFISSFNRHCRINA